MTHRPPIATHVQRLPPNARGGRNRWIPKRNRVRVEIAATQAIGRALRFFKFQREGRVDAVECHDLECSI